METKLSFEAKKPAKVYVKLNSENYIIDINSDIFINDYSGWQKFDEGYGDKYTHAQTNYFSNGLIDENGNYIYRI